MLRSVASPLSICIRQCLLDNDHSLCIILFIGISLHKAGYFGLGPATLSGISILALVNQKYRLQPNSRPNGRNLKIRTEILL